MRVDQAVTVLARAGCVAAAEEAAELWAAAGADPEVMSRLVGRRAGGEPLAWVTGRTVFCGLVLAVDQGVYVPRWQTEPLAERAAALLPAGGRALDLCTGAGALAAVLAARVPGAEVIGTDIDPAAVECARRNGVDARRGHLDEPVPSDWMGTVDVVTAVAPYVPTGALHLLDRDSRDHEPRSALDGGEGGTRWIEEVVVRSPRWLRPGSGAVLLELGGDQHLSAGRLLDANGFGPVRVLRDGEGDVRGVESHLLATRSRP